MKFDCFNFKNISRQELDQISQPTRDEIIKSAQQGDTLAQEYLGILYANGFGVSEDITMSFYWNLQASQNGNSIAMSTLAWMYHKGLGTPIDNKKFLEWNLQAAKQGEVIAQYNLGWGLLTGIDGETDINQGIYWLEKAGENGLSMAYWKLAKVFDNGLNKILIDKKHAFQYYSKGAQLGDQRCEYDIGVMYYSGEFVKQNFAQAIFWFDKAAKHGYYDAHYNLGVMYYEGQGVKPNKVQSLIHFLIAKQLGAFDTHEKINLICSQISEADITEAQHQAQSYPMASTPAYGIVHLMIIFISI
jgi:TPR repeat protein